VAKTDEYLDLLRQNTEAQRAATAESKRLADETARLADEEAKRRKAEQIRLQMMTEIAAGAVKGSETATETRQELSALRDYLRLNIEAFKEKLDEVRFQIESVKARVNIIAGQLSEAEPEILREFERLDERESLQFQIDQYHRSLQDLEQQKAMQGAFPDVALIRQIEYISRQIEELETKLEDVGKKIV
jgi:DNA repair exonuclease SbcCD ATPase subunit